MNTQDTPASTSGPTKNSPVKDNFAEQAEQASPGLIAEFWDFLIHNKKWWITPIVVVLLIMTAFVVLSGTPIAPFIYTIC